jgi:large conductance mechanosensitive channel
VVLLGVFLAEDERILAELVKIREALTAAPAPPPEPKGLWMEFIDFINKYGVVGLAIGFIIGSASRDLVNALVADILMPVITFFIPGGAWEEATLTVGPVVLALGHFVGALLDYLIIALIVFYLMRVLKRTSLK